MPEPPACDRAFASSRPYPAEVIAWYVGVAGLALGHTVVAQLVLLGCAAYRLVKEPDSRRASMTQSAKILLALAAWMLFTAAFAWKPDNALGSTLGAMLTGWLVFIATKRAAASGFGARLIRVFLASACAGALYALVQFGMFVLKHTGTPRAQLPFAGCNTAGTVMAVATIVAIGCASRSTRTVQKLAMAACAVLTFLALVATQSRGALVAFVAGLVVLAGALLFSRHGRSGLARATLVLVALVLLLGAFSAVYPPLRTRYATILRPAANQDRLDIWSTAIAIIRDHPLVGVGVNNFRDAYMAYPHARSPVQEQPFAHNVFLEFGAAAGVPGLVLVALVIGAGIANGLHAWKRQAAELGAARELPATSLAVFVAVVVHLQFDLSIYSIDMLPLFFIPYATLAWLAERARAGNEARHSRKVTMRAGNTTEDGNAN